MKFPCKRCGLCCRNIGDVPQLADFDDGTGVCIHLTKDSLCDIYAERPVWCNVEKLYELSYKHLISEKDWIEANSRVCRELMGRRT